MINITHCLVYTGLCSAKLGGVHDAGRGGRATGALDGQQVFRRQGEGKGGGRGERMRGDRGVIGAGLNMGHAVAKDRVYRQNLLTSLSQMPCLPPACAKDSL